MIYNIENHPKSLIHVFNRWGSEVFFAQNYLNNWDGHYKNLNQPLPDGSYYYQIDLDGNGSVDKEGWIYITRL
jgi:gliding motility-associated-like protein